MEEVLRKIEDVKNTNSLELNLSCLELTEIPKEVFDLEKVETLKLMYNKITNIPIEISKMRNLKNLYISFNKIKEISKELLIEMPNVECFDLAENPFDYIEAVNFHRDNNKWIGYRECLNKIEIAKNNNYESFHHFGNLKTFPIEVFELPNLISLSLCLGKNIKEIPKGVKNLKNLEYIDLSGNNIADLPTDFYELENLKSVILNSNSFKDIPQKLFDLPNLHSLHISNNDITWLDKTIFKNEKIKSFYALENPFENFDSKLFNYGYEEMKKQYI